MIDNKKAQASMDFIIGFSLFLIVALLTSKIVIDNLRESTPQLIDETAVLSENLMSSGLPENWNYTNVIRIGLLDNNRLTKAKLLEFEKISYAETKRRLSIKNDYAFFFQKNSSLVNITACNYGMEITKVENNSCVLDLSKIEYTELVKLSRLLIYNSSIIEMVIYQWD